ncbi:unnamed protein product [Symbiodinium sp. CCMP2592]|nr:unnamed protein product [Symbiodinium sp. CCMP2592]
MTQAGSVGRSMERRRSRTRWSKLRLCFLGALVCVVGATAAAFCGSRPEVRQPARLRSLGTALRRPATATRPAEGSILDRPPQVLAEDALKLLQEFGEVAASTGMEMGLRRGLQAAQAAAATAAEVARKPPAELDEAFVAKVLRKLFERLGSTYVKLGQFIASSPTVFPAPYVKEFQRCLDSTSTVSFVEVKRIIERELGRPLRDVYAYVDPTPLASASIAQVHTGRLRDGSEVVVKVQKPGIEEVLKTDLGVVYLAARILEFINPDLNIRGSLADIASDLRQSMLGELDFREEQKNLDVYRDFLDENGLTAIAVAPKPYPEASSKRVLTMERLSGVPLVDLEGIKKYTADPEATLVNALNVWALSVQKCEFFHADVHAGNLLVLEDGRVGFIDFGIVGRLSPQMATGIDKLNTALAVSDARGMANALISMGATVGEVDEEAFAADIQKLISSLGNTLDNSTDMAVDESKIQDIVLDIAQVAGNNGLKLPREFGLLIKQSLYFDRYTKLLAPDLNMMSDERIANFGQDCRLEFGLVGPKA